MRKAIKFIKSMFVGRDKVNPWLMSLFFISTIIIVFTNLVWVNTIEFFKYGSEIGSILNNFAIGFLAAFIFYMIDIWWPAIEKKRTYYKIINMQLNKIQNALDSPLLCMAKDYNNIEYENCLEIKDDILIKAFNFIDLSNDKGHIFNSSNRRMMIYIEYLFYHVNEIEEAVKRINEIHYFDKDLYELLDKLRSSTYNSMITVMMSQYLIDKKINKSNDHTYVIENKQHYLDLINFRKNIIV